MIIGKMREDSLKEPTIPIVDTSYDLSTIIHTKEVLSGLRSIADRYNQDLDQRANAYADEQVKGTFDSDEELLRKAKESLEEIYGEKKGQKTGDYIQKSGDLAEKKDALSVDRALALDKVGEKYDAKRGTLAEDLSKKGLSHSSIANLAKEDLDVKRGEELAQVNYSYDKKVQAVDAKIDRLKSSYETALENYEISYALQLEKEIARLQKKRDKMEDEYAKEHRSERDAAYDEYLEKDRVENKAYEDRTGDYTGAKRENYKERYNYLVDQLKDKNAKSVAKFISQYENTLRDYLGLYYEDFVKEVT